MTEQNKAAQQRRTVFTVLRDQQEALQRLSKENRDLRLAVATLAVQTRQQGHPYMASIMQRVADDMPDSNAEAVAPQAKDDPQAVGASPTPANTGVTPDATADVQDTGVVPTSVPARTDVEEQPPAEVLNPPTPDAAKVPTQFNNGTPDMSTFDTPAFASKQADNQQVRFMTALRLAKNRITAGIPTDGAESGEEIVVAQAIIDSNLSVEAMQIENGTLEKVALSRQASTAPASRRLVPQAAAGGESRTPSLAGGAPGTPLVSQVSNGEVTDDEFLLQ